MNWKEGWPEDILRHSYGSYRLAKYRNAALAAHQNGAQECADALCALSRGSEKFRRYHRVLDDLSVRRWQSSQLRGVIDWKWEDLEFVPEGWEGMPFIRPPSMVATRILHDTIIM